MKILFVFILFILLTTQLFQQDDEKVGKAEHINDGSTIAIRTG